MTTNLVYLKKPNRGCGSTSYVFDLIGKNPEMRFYLIAKNPESIRSAIKNDYRHLKNVDVIKYSMGEFPAKLRGHKGFIIVFLDWNAKDDNMNQCLHEYNRNSLNGSFGIIVEDITDIKPDLIYAPYIPLMTTITTANGIKIINQENVYDMCSRFEA